MYMAYYTKMYDPYHSVNCNMTVDDSLSFMKKTEVFSSCDQLGKLTKGNRE